MKRIKQTALKFLREGLSRRRVAMAMAVGMTMGVFPVYGPVSILVLAIAWVFQLNKPVVLAAYYGMTFVKPLLIIPFLRFGEFLFQAEPMGISLVELTRQFSQTPMATLQEFSWSFVHATVGWMVAVPLILGLVYGLSFLAIARWLGQHAQPRLGRARTGLFGLTTLLLALGLTPDASAFWKKESPGDLFAQTVSVGDKALVLQGTGLLKYKHLIPVYDAALYTEEGVDRENMPGKKALRLEVVYRVSAEARRFNEAGADVLARNYGEEQLAVLEERINRINALYPDAQKGDRCAITYIPGKGTELSYNGEVLGLIEGEDFASAYFSIWLGDDPASTRLRDSLLGKS